MYIVIRILGISKWNLPVLSVVPENTLWLFLDVKDIFSPDMGFFK